MCTNWTCSSLPANDANVSFGLGSPLLAWQRLSGRLLRCLHALAAPRPELKLDGSQWGAAQSGATAGSEEKNGCLHESSVCHTPRNPKDNRRSPSQCVSRADSFCSISENPSKLEVDYERKWREETNKRRQLQHTAASLQRRVLELTEDLNDAKIEAKEQTAAAEAAAISVGEAAKTYK